ncbi:MAG: GNAT family N-acetyltransferase [Thermodesulfobacteriota bacterium]
MSNTAQIEVLPLTYDVLNDTLSLLKKVFISKEDQDIFPLSLKESLSEAHSKTTYWIAIEKGTNVVGITGLYNDSRDKNTVWLGWFGVHPACRNRGVGSALLEFAIKEANHRGFSILKLYSSSDNNERDAHKLYRRFGFTQSDEGENSDRIYFTKILCNSAIDRKEDIAVHKIEIEWEGPFGVEEVITRMTDEGESPEYDGNDYGLYQIYGEHILCGKDTLLYIGKAPEQTFAARFSQHKKWLDSESGIQVYIGRIYDPERHLENDRWKSWEEDVDTAERIMIYKYSPHYNSRSLANPPKLASKVQLIHNGVKHKLKFEDNAPQDY